MPERRISVLPQRLLRSDGGNRDGDDGSWEFEENALLFHAATILVLVAFGGLSPSPCYETMSLQIGLAGRHRFLIPFEANARHIGNVKQSVTNFIGLL